MFKCGWLAAWRGVLGIYALVKRQNATYTVFWLKMYTDTLTTHIHCTLNTELCTEVHHCVGWTALSTIHHAVTLWPVSLKYKNKHICKHACWQAHTCQGLARAVKHKCTQTSTSNLMCFLMHVHRCKYSHLWTRFNPHMSRMKNIKLRYIHQTTLHLQLHITSSCR